MTTPEAVRVNTPPTDWDPKTEPCPAGWWRREASSESVVCELCPRGCHIAPDKSGYCFVRKNEDGRLINTTYGRSTGFCVDPIEKKPLFHFHPGTPILSFGTPGCNLGCRCCQNWTTARNEHVAAISELALPEAIVAACLDHDIPSIAYTYNEPTVWAEYAIDTARAARENGLMNVAVTNGYISPEPRKAFYEFMDAANVDLKGFNEEFYRSHTKSHLAPVLDTLRYLVRETPVWVEITNLVIPNLNDDMDEIRRMCDWILDTLGPDVPLHFSAFHPAFQMMDRPSTPALTLLLARKAALRAGLNYVYVGNISADREQSTFCPDCEELLIGREAYELAAYRLIDDTCRYCGSGIAGRFSEKPGDWGSRRMPIDIGCYAEAGEKLRRSVTKRRLAGESNATGPNDARKPNERKHDMTSVPDSVKPSTSDDKPLLTSEQRELVFQTAGRRVAAAVQGVRGERLDQALGEIAQLPLIGAFVSLKRQGQLRSCCGTMAPSLPLFEALDGAALRAATDDPRFPPISASELPHLDMEVWLLWGMKPVEAKGEDRGNAIEIGRHGVQISRGYQRGLLLPGVAIEHKMDQRAFLEAVCRKAGLPLEAWREDDTILQTFEGYAISEPFANVKLPDEGHAALASRPSHRELERLAAFSHQNYLAMLEGATPSYFLAGGYDGNVAGILLRVSFPGHTETIDVTKIAMREELPLQSNLFELVKSAVSGIVARKISNETAMTGQVELTILTDVALHGTALSPSVEGLDVATRTLMLLHEGRWALACDPNSTPQALLDDVRTRGLSRKGEDASLISFATSTTAEKLQLANIPRPTAGPAVRSPAVAGQFYPAAPEEVDRMLDEMIPEEGEKQTAHALMAPHAGWVYSGRLAGKTLSRVEIPEQVIVFCPSHRGGGSDWAVAPHEIWRLPGGDVESDPKLARELADAVEGFELDSVAHIYEHAIEVQLPIIRRLSPQSKVVGVAMGRADFDELQTAAGQLAAYLDTLPEWPLLVVSSDMNHFADEKHTKKIDRVALDAIETLNPRNVYDTVIKSGISMCGMIPCVLVMETLRQAGKLHRAELIGYATSAETSGDTRRVVGYAGMLFD